MQSSLSKKGAYIIAIVIIALGAGLYFIYHLKPNLSGSNVTTLPDIAAPNGWTADRQSSDRITFMRQGKDIASSGRIDVSAVKINKNLEQWLAGLYSGGNFPYALTATSSPSGAEAITWALVNGHLVLADSDRESGAGTALNYSLYDNGNVYAFSLLPYQLYNLPNKTFVTKNPGDIQTLKALVQNFATSLPSNTPQ